MRLAREKYDINQSAQTERIKVEKNGDKSKMQIVETQDKSMVWPEANANKWQ